MAELEELYFPPAPWMFGAAGIEHSKKYGSTADHFVKIAAKNHRHSVNNPYAQFQEDVHRRADQGRQDDLPAAELTRLDVLAHLGRVGCSGARQRAVRRRARLGDRAIEIVGQAMVTEYPARSTFAARLPALVGADMSAHCGAAGLRAGRHRTRRRRRHRTARLLRAQRAADLRSARACAPKVRATTSSTQAIPPTAGVG